MAIWRATVRISHAALGGTATNTWHCRTTDSGTVGLGQANILAGYLQDFYMEANQMLPDAGSTAFDGVFTGVGPSAEDSMEGDLWTVPGNNTSNVLPPANALVVNWIGLTGDRSKRGRTFLGPIGFNCVDPDGTPTAAVLGLVRDAAAALVSASLTDGNGAWGVWSREGTGTLRDFAQSSVNNQFAVLRSRRD